MLITFCLKLLASAMIAIITHKAPGLRTLQRTR